MAKEEAGCVSDKGSAPATGCLLLVLLVFNESPVSRSLISL